MAEVIRLRRGIRYAFQQANDSKCWLDYFKLNELLPDKPLMNRRMLSEKEMENNCKTFIKCVGCHVRNPDLSIDEVYEIWEKEKPYE